MFDGYDENRVAAMTDQERRWFDNVKKAFHGSDTALQNGSRLEELFKAVDTAKTLRRSLRGEDTSHRDNKKRFIEVLGLEIPMARLDGSEFELRDAESVEDPVLWTRGEWYSGDQSFLFEESLSDL